MNEAYQRLDDHKGLAEYCKKFIEQYLDTEISLDFDIPSYDQADDQEYIYMQILPEILRPSADHIRPFEVTSQRNFILRTLGDAHFYWARILQTDEEYNQAIEHYFKSFVQYKECIDQNGQNASLIKFIDKLKEDESVDVISLVSAYVSISPVEATRLWLKVAAGFRQSNLQSDASAAQVNNSIVACSSAYKNMTEVTPLLKAACHFTMLRIYKDLRYADDTGRIFIEQMARDDNYQQSKNDLTQFDKRLLCQWVRDFIIEYNQKLDDEQSKIPDTLANQFHPPSLISAMKEAETHSQCLGDILMLLNDYSGAVAYWKWIVSEYESIYSKLEQQIIYDDDATINDVFDEMRELNQNAHEHILHLADCYEQLTNYQIHAGELPNVSASDTISCFENAIISCEKTIEVRKRSSKFQRTKLNELQELLNKIQNKLNATKTNPKQDEIEAQDSYPESGSYGSDTDDLD